MPGKSENSDRKARRAGSPSHGSGGARVDVGGPPKDVFDKEPPLQHWRLIVLLTSALGVVAGALVIALSLLSVGMPAGTAPGSPVPQGEERRAIGNPSAPVVVTEWFDFQCPACRVYALSRDPALEQLYLADGKVRFEYRNFAFLGPESLQAAEAAECAADQGRYRDYRALLFQRQRGENRGAFQVENLKAFAAELGLDQGRFNACLDQGVHRASILEERKEGEALGVNATPTLFVNDTQMEGVPSLDRMKAAIEQELAKKR